MNLDYLKKNKRIAPPALLILSVVFAALTAYRLWDYKSSMAKAQSIVSQAAEKDKPDPDNLEKSLAGLARIADAIKKQNLFIPPAPKRHPVTAVLGIMGNEALINGKWYKVGDKIADAEVVAVEPTLVKIKWDGSEKTFAPISAMIPESSGPGRVTRVAHGDKDNEKEKKKEPKKDTKQKKTKEVKIASGHDPLDWMGVDLPPHLHKKIMKLWKNASEEDKRRGMAEWNNASDERKRQMLSQLEAMPDSAMGG